MCGGWLLGRWPGGPGLQVGWLPAPGLGDGPLDRLGLAPNPFFLWERILSSTQSYWGGWAGGLVWLGHRAHIAVVAGSNPARPTNRTFITPKAIPLSHLNQDTFKTGSHGRHPMLRGLNRNLVYLFLLNLAFGFSMQLVQPLFPLYMESVGAGEAQTAWVVSAGGLVATLLMLPSGLLLDKVGRKPLLLASAAVNTLSILLLSQVQSWTLVAPIFIAFSAAGALFIPARMAMITENSEPQVRATVFGLMNMAWPIAGVVSPLVSGYLVEGRGWHAVFYLGAAVNAFSLLPAAGIQGRSREARIEAANGGGGLRDLFQPSLTPILASFFAFHLLMTTALGSINLIIPIYLDADFGLPTARIGLFFTAQSLLTLATQAPSGRLADKIGRKRFILACITPIPLLYASWYWLSDWRLMLATGSLAFGLWSMTWPATLALLADNVPDHLVGAAFGVRMTGVRLGFTLGPLLGSYIYLNHGHQTPFLAAAALALAGLTASYTLRERVPEATPQPL